MKLIRHLSFALFFGFTLPVGIGSSFGAGSTLIDNVSGSDRALITLPHYTLRPFGKWAAVIVDQKKLQFQSTDGAEHMQAGTVDLHPKLRQTEDDAFRSYVDNRRQQERENIDNKALKADAIDYSSGERGKIAWWCIIDPAGASAHLTAILENERKLLVISYEADKITEAEFRKRAAMVTGSMTLL